MIDTHAHWPETDLEPGWMTGLKWVVLAGTDYADSSKNIDLSLTHSQVKAAVGYHPEGLADDLEVLKKLTAENRNRIFALGECGLDILAPNLERQKEYFRQQVAMALDFDLPLIIHCRKLNDELIEILKKFPKHRGVFHCYTGGKKRINKILDIGEWYFGLDGNLTYENGLVEVVKNIPRERLVLETDSPYLTPQPLRGETNKPSNVKYIYEKVAQIWEKELGETEEFIDQNAKRLFKIIGEESF